MAEEKKKGNPIIFGLLVLGAAIGALWKNEYRFDYYKAAKNTPPTKIINNLSPNTLFSHTGKMDQSLTLKGHYVNSFQGYLEVNRRAEIYAWHRKKDDDGVKWTKKWMSGLQNNERNKGLKKHLRGDNFRPKTYQVSQLAIQPKDIQFVDKKVSILPSQLKITQQGSNQKLSIQGDYFYLAEDEKSQVIPEPKKRANKAKNKKGRKGAKRGNTNQRSRSQYAPSKKNNSVMNASPIVASPSLKKRPTLVNGGKI